MFMQLILRTDRLASYGRIPDYYSSALISRTGGSKLEAFHHGCLRRMCGLTMWDVTEKRITNEHVTRGMVADSPTIDSLMETRRCWWLSKLSVMKQSRSPWRMLDAWGTTSRPVGRPQQTIRHAYISTLKKLGFEGEKGQLWEWMTVARDISARGRKVESYKLLLPPGSFTTLRRHWTKHERFLTNWLRP
jgi:hypothetical protein